MSRVPVPPADLSVRVTGSADPGWYDESGRRHLALFERALSHTGKRLSEFEDIYDFGCGPGRIMRHVAEAAPQARLHGSDVQAPGVEWLRQQLPEADLRVNGGLPPLPFPADSFDLVISWSVFTHLPEGHQNAWLAELARVARPGAVLLLTVHGDAAWRWHLERSSLKDAPELEALTGERERKGFADWTGGVGPGFPDYYRTAFHRPSYIRDHWAQWLRVVDVLEAPVSDDPDQDVVVLEHPGRVGAALRLARRAPGGVRRKLRRPASEPGAELAERKPFVLGTPADDRLVSIVLPAKDPGAGLSELVDAIRGQRWDGQVELVVVDSGSRDGTPDRMRELGATVVEADPAAFDHGENRNLGAQYARGDTLVFVTQSMRPADEGWLAGLLAALDREPRLAGVSSRVKPLPWADHLARRDAERDLTFSAERRVRSREDPDGHVGFTTVSCAIRAEVLREIPFRSVETIGEDLVWAKEALEAGHLIGHEPDSVALHSHDYSFDELLGRDFDDGVARLDVEGRRLEGDAILADIGTLVEADRRYLSEECGLEGAELEFWVRRSASRRTAQLVGQWLGTNHDRLAPEALEALSLVRRVVRED